MLDSYIRNCLSNLNRRVTELEESKKRPTKPSDDSGGTNIPPDGIPPEQAVVTWADLDTAFLHANFRSLKLSKQINEDYDPEGDEPYYINGDDDPVISLDVIHGKARIPNLTITEGLFKEVVVKNEEEEDEIEYYDYLTRNEAYTKEEVDATYARTENLPDFTRITTLEQNMNKICTFSEAMHNIIFLKSRMYFGSHLTSSRDYMYFKSHDEFNYFCLRDTSTKTETSILEFVFLEGNYSNPTHTTSLIKIYADQVEIPKLIQATDNPYLTKNDINEFSYNNADNKLHCTATIRFDASNFQDNENVCMEIYSTYGYSEITYALKEVAANGNLAKVKIVSVKDDETTLLQLECDRVVIPELYKDADTPYATETFVNEQINNFGSNFYVVEVVIPANKNVTELANTIPDYATKIQTHKLIMPNTDGKHIFTLRKSSTGTYGANWVSVVVTAEKITFTSVYVSTEEIRIYAQFEWVAKPTA